MSLEMKEIYVAIDKQLTGMVAGRLKDRLAEADEMEKEIKRLNKEIKRLDALVNKQEEALQDGSKALEEARTTMDDMTKSLQRQKDVEEREERLGYQQQVLALREDHAREKVELMHGLIQTVFRNRIVREDALTNRPHTAQESYYDYDKGEQVTAGATVLKECAEHKTTEEG